MKMRALPFLILAIVMAATYSFADEYIVDNDAGSPGFTKDGDWSVSVSSGYNGGQYEYTFYDTIPSYCVWTPEILVAGTYEVYAIYRQSTNRTTNAPYTIGHTGGTDIVNIDQNGSNALIETKLGDFYFNTGSLGYVRLDNNGGTGAYIADAVRFTLLTDGSPVISGVSRSPQDPTDTDTVMVTATIIDDGTVTSATLTYVSTPAGSSDTVTLYDDGAHNDGAAGDSVYGASIPAQPDGDTVTYYISATDDAVQTSVSPDQDYTIGIPDMREYRSIWADTWNVSILNASQCDDLIQTCRDNNINTVMVEIRKIGDAYYNSNIEPRATNISGGSTFDPLGYLLSIAHDTSGGKKYIEVHGWFVAQRISKGETLNPQHVLSLHPEYIMSSSTGGTSYSGSIFIDPGHPGAVDHNVAVITDCLSNYAIDGINLDYIRYPGSSWGYNPESVARYNEINGYSGQPSTSDSEWSDWRRQCLSLAVKKIYIKSLMIDPDVVLTADTVQWGYSYDDFESSDAYAGVFQDWVGWLEEGIIDYNALMNYSTSTSRYEGWTDLSLASDDKRGSIIGIGAYLQSTVQRSVDQLLYARNQGAAGLNIYDWGSEVNAASETRAQFYSAIKSQVFPEWADPPDHAWKSSPTTGIYEGNLADNGVPIDHGTVAISGLPELQTVTDGSGWYAIMDVPPGSHTLVFSKTGYTDVQIPASLPAAGDIITINADFTDQAPVAAFSADITRDCDSLTACFTDESAGATIWEWDFDGDSLTDSTDQNPCFVYTQPGTYDVSLTVGNGTDDDTATKEDYITVLYSEDICVSGTNLMGTTIYNSDFESGMSGDTPAGWTSSGQDYGDKTTAFSLETTEPYAGLASALVETSGTPADPNDLSIASLVCDTSFALVKDHTYLVTAMVRRSQSQWSRMILHSAGFSLIQTESYDALDDGIEDSGWQKLSLHFTAPINIAEAYFRIDSIANNSRTASGGTVKMWMDEVSVIDLGTESYTDIYNETTPPQYGVRNRYFDLATETEVSTIGGTAYSCTNMPRRWNIAFAVDTGSNNAAGYPLWGQETPSGLNDTSGEAGYVRAMAADTSKPAWPAIYADGVNFDSTANDGRRHVLSFDYGAAGTTRPLLRVFMIEDDFDHYASLFVDPVVGVPGNRMWPLVIQTTPSFSKGLLITRFDNVTLGSTGSGVHTDETTVYIDNVIMNSVD